MKKLLIGVGIVVVLGIVCLGFDGLKSHVEASKQVIKDKIASSTSSEYDEARIKSLLASERTNVKTYEGQIKGLDAKIARENQVIAKAETDLVEHRQTLAKAGDLLKAEKTIYVINGKEYTKAEVNNDAIARLSCVKKLASKITLHKTLVSDLSKASELSKVSLREAIVKIQEVETYLETLKAREVNAEIKARIATLSDDMTSFSSNLSENSALQDAMGSYEKKVIAKEAMGDIDSSTVITIIDYTEPAEVDALSTVEKIAAVLQ
jgi:phage shock protein A